MKVIITLLTLLMTQTAFSKVCNVSKGSKTFALEYSCKIGKTKYEIFTSIDDGLQTACLKETAKAGNVIISFHSIDPEMTDEGVYYHFSTMSFIKLDYEKGNYIYRIDKAGEKLCDEQYPAPKRF